MGTGSSGSEQYGRRMIRGYLYIRVESGGLVTQPLFNFTPNTGTCGTGTVISSHRIGYSSRRAAG